MLAGDEAVGAVVLRGAAAGDDAALEAGVAAGSAVLPGSWRRTISGNVARCLNSGSLGI